MMLRRLLLGCALGVALATPSYGANAQGFGFGGFGGNLEADAGILLIIEGVEDLLQGNPEGKQDIAFGEDLIQEAVSETRSRG